MDAMREPCPWRIVHDVGSGFAMGSIGGGVWHGVSALRNSAGGGRETFARSILQRWGQAVSGVREKAPRTGGSFAVWGGLFSSCDCVASYARGVEDAWNSIMSGAITGGFLSINRGPRAALTSAVAGGFILAAIEGAAFYLSRKAPANDVALMPLEEDTLNVEEDTGVRALWKNLFGGSKPQPEKQDYGDEVWGAGDSFFSDPFDDNSADFEEEEDTLS